MSNTENSPEQLIVTICPTCQATWINGVLTWKTGKHGTNLDLAGLVCNPYSKGRACLNPELNQIGGDTWEKRAEYTKRFSVIDEFFGEAER